MKEKANCCYGNEDCPICPKGERTFKLWSELHPEVKWKIRLALNWYYIRKWIRSVLKLF